MIESRLSENNPHVVAGLQKNQENERQRAAELAKGAPLVELSNKATNLFFLLAGYGRELEPTEVPSLVQQYIDAAIVHCQARIATPINAEDAQLAQVDLDHILPFKDNPKGLVLQKIERAHSDTIRARWTWLGQQFPD